MCMKMLEILAGMLFLPLLIELIILVIKKKL
jgi:hypothetical protein